jgi:hypothetical protein
VGKHSSLNLVDPHLTFKVPFGTKGTCLDLEILVMYTSVGKPGKVTFPDILQ